MEESVITPIQLRAAREAFSTWDGFLAFGFGAGLLPKAPGTMGSLVALPFVFAVNSVHGYGRLLLLAGLFMLGVWICKRVGQRLGVDDYGGIVWDEMFGIWLTLSVAPMQWYWILCGFALFRFFDIIKPWPIGELEVRFDGGLGVMLDDVLAAFYAMILLGGAQHVFGA